MIIHARVDDVSEMLMKELDLEIPKFNLSRWFKCQIEELASTGREVLKVRGIDACGGAFSLFKSVQINGKETRE